MKKITIVLILGLSVIGLQGCAETFKGVQKDTKAFMNPEKRKDGVVYKADNWVRENMW
jgi:hypothetical protein